MSTACSCTGHVRGGATTAQADGGPDAAHGPEQRTGAPVHRVVPDARLVAVPVMPPEQGEQGTRRNERVGPVGDALLQLLDGGHDRGAGNAGQGSAPSG